MMNSNEKSWTNTSFVDANIFVYAFTHTDPVKIGKCRALLERMEKSGALFATNYLALIEACNCVAKLVSKVTAQKAFRDLLSLEGLSLVPIGNTLFFEALKSYGKSSLNFADHIHYTTARTLNAAQIYSYDKDFDNLDIPRVEP